MGRGTGDPLHTLGLADITRHALERDPGGRCCNLNFPEGSSSARSAAPWQKQQHLVSLSNSRSLLAAPGLAASRCERAHMGCCYVVFPQQHPHMQCPRSSQRQACPAPGCSAPPCYASLLCERQQARAEAHPARCSQADCQALRALGERKQCTSESVSSAIF